MSLNSVQRAQTSCELHELRSLLPVSDADLADRLGLSVMDLRDVLDVTGRVDPREVWRVRDTLVSVAEAHDIPVPRFTVLSEDRRSAAEGWFGSWTVPDVDDL